jgi:amino acid transporter
MSSAPPALRQGALRLPALLMQGLTHIAPAVGLLLSIQFITAQAGTAAPLAYAIAFVLVLLLGISLTQLCRHIPSAGGYYTFISRTVHPRAGFLTAWIYFLYDPTSTAINLAFAGAFFEKILLARWGVRLPWWAFFLCGTAIVTTLCYRGVEISARAMAVLCGLEILIVAALAAGGALRPGPGAAPLSPFDPAMKIDGNGLYLGVIFSIFAFTGFESVAPLAEESHDPRRNVPRSILLSIGFMGFFYTACAWGILSGWGAAALPSFVASEENPALVLARRLWGGGWVLLLIAVLNSILGVCIACTNAATRVLYAMGRSGSLPRGLAAVHPRFKTPTAAIWAQTAVTLVVGLGLGWIMGPAEEFFFMGVAITLGMVLVYSAGNLGVVRLYRGERRAEWNPALHLICPVLSTAALLFVGYKSVVPLPTGVLRWAPLLVLVWVILGVALVLAGRFRPQALPDQGPPDA